MSFLGTVENMTELKPEICVTAGEQGLIAWLLKRLRVITLCFIY